MVRYVLLPVVDIMNENIKDVEIAWGTVPIENNLLKMLISAVFWQYFEIGRFL